jgi:hypothetical protein
MYIRSVSHFRLDIYAHYNARVLLVKNTLTIANKFQSGQALPFKEHYLFLQRCTSSISMSYLRAFLHAQCQQLLENFIYILIQSSLPINFLLGRLLRVIAITPRSTPLTAA